MKFLFLLSIFILFVIIPVQAQQSDSTFTVDIEIRPRFELRNGFKAPIEKNEDPAAFVEQRSRIYLDYDSGPYRLHLALQDVRIWGNQNQIFKEDDALTNIYEAWGSYNLNEKWSLKFGRQALDYDNARFLGDLDWAQQGRSHDALLVQYQNPEKNLLLDAGVTFNQVVEFEPTRLTDTFFPLQGNNKTMQYLWLNQTFEKAGFSYLFHNDGRQVVADSSVSFRQTTGLNGFYHFGNFTYRGEFYYQFGKDPAKATVSAFLFNSEIIYPIKNYTFTFGVDWLSGTELDSSKNRSFEPLYGTNHKFYGYMDFFHVGNPHRQPGNPYNVGFINFYQKLKIGLTDKASFDIHIHEFISDAEVFDPFGNSMSSYLGTEVDLLLTVRPAKAATFFLGYSQMIQTDTMERVKGNVNASSFNGWAWAMFRLNPTVLGL
ncbi:MAG: alginate export family protein [Balneolaceae bacterium]